MWSAGAAWRAATAERTAALAALTSTSTSTAAASSARLQAAAEVVLAWLERRSETLASEDAAACAEAGGRAETAKTAGNAHYQRSEHPRAARAYTEAARLAAQARGAAGPTVAVCLANRSAALAELKDWAGALRDVDAALAEGYPARGRTRLLRRRALALEALGQPEAAWTALQAAAAHVAADEGVSDVLRASLDADALRLQAAAASLASASSTSSPSSLPPTAGVMREVHGMQDGPDGTPYGRHLVVAGGQPLAAGTRVLSEAPTAVVMAPGAPACTCCGSTAVVYLLPCTQCGVAQYCDAACARRDAAAGHAVECSVIAVGAQPGWGPSFLLAVRAWHVAHHPTSGRPDAASVSGVPLAQELARLESHWDRLDAQTLADGPLLLAAWAVRRWTEAKIGSTGAATPQTVAAHVVRTCAMRANAFAIQTETGGAPLGLGLYALATRFNHSCEPNCMASFDGVQLHVHVTTAAAPGTQLCVSYGPVANRASTTARQAQLRDRYTFTCMCPACTRPEPAARPPMDAWRCQATAGCDGAVDPQRLVCAACRQLVTHVDATRGALAQAAELADGAVVLLDGMDEDAENRVRARQTGARAAKMLEAAVVLRRQHLHRTNRLLGRTWDTLARAHVAAECWPEAADALAASLTVVQALYGPASVEWAREACKLAEVLFISGDRARARQVLEPALAVLTTHFGPRHPMLADFQRLWQQLV